MTNQTALILFSDSMEDEREFRTTAAQERAIVNTLSPLCPAFGLERMLRVEEFENLAEACHLFALHYEELSKADTASDVGLSSSPDARH